MAMKKRSCRACGSEFETGNNSTLCNVCSYKRRRDISPRCPECGGAKDPRAARCRACRKLPNRRGPSPLRGPRYTATEVIDRARATAEPDGDCLLATAWTPQPTGYLRVAAVDERGQMLLHRLVMEQTLGRRLVDGETVDHTCHNAAASAGTCDGGWTCRHRRCVNPDHLDVATGVENWARGLQGTPRERREKTHCPAGHPYEPANQVGGTPNGWRSCKACHRARQAGRDPRAEPTYLS